MKNKKVILYTMPACVYCRMAKAFFGVRGIPYEEIDVSRDGAAREAISRKFGAKSVPVVELESEVMIGFDRERLLEIFRED